MIALLLVALLANGYHPQAPGAESLDHAFERLSARRAEQIERVRRYAAAGNFPRNLDFPGKLVPYFIDAAGTPCAVGHLMLCDGWTNAVVGIVKSDNHVRIENIDGGPVQEWARSSGLTLAECALIQPSYACIEDYRRGREWNGEVQRLQEHFAKVEKRLIDQTTESLAESLAAEVDHRLKENPADPAFGLAALQESLRSDEPAVRIAAARALAHESLSASPKGPRIEALRKSLDDADPAVRFWSADALRRIASTPADSPYYAFAGPTGVETQLNALTGPVFLATWREGPPELRHAALVQIAQVAPESIASSKQMRWVPEARRIMVEACDDKDAAIAAFAQERMKTFRWQRIVFESQRMRRQYLVATHADEALASELLLLGEHFAPESEIVDRIAAICSAEGSQQGMVHLLPNAEDRPIVTAATPIEAQQAVASELGWMYGRMKQEPPEQKLVAAAPDRGGLFIHVHYLLGGGEAARPLHYIVPTPALLKHCNMSPQNWTQGRQTKIEPSWPAGEMMVFDFKEGVDIALGNNARASLQAFESACDFLCYFLAYRSRILIERDSTMQVDTLVWQGRFANLREHRSRFFEIEGGGSSTYAGGGWDFQEVEFRCDPATGQLTLSTTPEEFPVEQLGAEELDPPWTRDEKRRMGWAPLPGIEFYGDTLFPPEYVAAVESFEPADKPAFNNSAHRRHHMEKGLPSPHFLSAMQYAKAGLEEQEKLCLRLAASHATPPRIAEIAQWQLSRGRPGEARELANLCLVQWPGQPVATDVLRRLDAMEADKRQ